MFNFLRGLFGGKKTSPSKRAARRELTPEEKRVREEEEKAARAWYEEKSKRMEALLGEEHNMVMHAIIPFAVGGGLDGYYYPHGVPGTAIATKELCEVHGQGPKNRLWQNYELAMFTRHPLDLDQAKDPATPFGKAHKNMYAILNLMARYAGTATLNPNETCEFPEDMEGVGGKCLVLDAYPPDRRGVPADFGLLAIIEVFRSEMDFARENGTGELIARLEAAGHYPYSDMDRQAVA